MLKPSFKNMDNLLYSFKTEVFCCIVCKLWGKSPISPPKPQGQLDVFGRPKAKIDYLVLDAKLILINMNYVKKFLFLEIL